MGNWFGVTCDDNGGVVELKLQRINMSGHLEESIGDLFADPFAEGRALSSLNLYPRVKQMIT